MRALGRCAAGADGARGGRSGGRGCRAGPSRGRSSHYSDTPGHFWRKSGIFLVILSVLPRGLAPKVVEGCRQARMIQGDCGRRARVLALCAGNGRLKLTAFGRAGYPQAPRGGAAFL
jgi:hypothetical protein